MTEIKIRREFQIDKVATEDLTRFALTYIEIKDGYATATDGRMLAHVQIEKQPEGEAPIKALVHKSAFEAARTKKKKIRGRFAGKDNKFAKMFLNDDGSVMVPTSFDYKMQFDNPADIVYPNWPQVIPAGKPFLEVGVNVEYLLALSKALGTPTLRIQFYKPKEPTIGKEGVEQITTPMQILPILNGCDLREESVGNYGVLMPVHLSE